MPTHIGTSIELLLERDAAGEWWAVDPSADVLEFAGVSSAAEITSLPVSEAIRHWEIAPDHVRRVCELLDGGLLDECQIPTSWFTNPRTRARQWFAQKWELIDARHIRLRFLPLAEPDNLDQVLATSRTSCTYCGDTLPLVGGRGHRRGSRAVCTRPDCIRTAERERKRQWRLSRSRVKGG